jgi:hypothetical protein
MFEPYPGDRDYEAAASRREREDECFGDPRFTDDEERWGDYEEGGDD